MSTQDKLSSFPDELLHSIISFLPLISAITTSFLSKRWTNLWLHYLTNTTALDFTADFYNKQSPQHFVATVHRYLQLHGDNKLDSLRILCLKNGDFVPFVGGWIRKAAAKGFTRLELEMIPCAIDFDSINDYNEMTMMLYGCSDGLLDCKLLTHLSWAHCDFRYQFEFGGFSELRSVKLNYTDIDDDMLQSLLVGCVLLEDLCLMNCNSVRIIKASGIKLNLRELSVMRCSEVCELDFSAPKLGSFYYYGRIFDSREFSDISELVDAYVCLVYNKDDNVEDGQAMRLLHRISHVETLSLCSTYLMVKFTRQKIGSP